MRSIPDLFQRDPSDPRFVVPLVSAGTEWVLAGEGVATRQYNGVCVLFSPDLDPSYVSSPAGLQGWWVRTVIKLGGRWPAYFIEDNYEEGSERTIGWEPADVTAVAKPLAQAVADLRDGPGVGTHELIGPGVVRNPDRAPRPRLIAHADAELVPAPRTYDGLRDWLPRQSIEGVVWHWQQTDGRVLMVKAKRRDFRA